MAFISVAWVASLISLNDLFLSESIRLNKPFPYQYFIDNNRNSTKTLNELTKPCLYLPFNCILTLTLLFNQAEQVEHTHMLSVKDLSDLETHLWLFTNLIFHGAKVYLIQSYSESESPRSKYQSSESDLGFLFVCCEFSKCCKIPSGPAEQLAPGRDGCWTCKIPVGWSQRGEWLGRLVPARWVAGQAGPTMRAGVSKRW